MEYGTHAKGSAKVKHLIWFKWNQNNYIVLGPDSQKPFMHYKRVDGKQDNDRSSSTTKSHTQSHRHPFLEIEINQHRIWRTKYFPNILMDQALSVAHIHITYTATHKPFNHKHSQYYLLNSINNGLSQMGGLPAKKNCSKSEFVLNFSSQNRKSIRNLIVKFTRNFTVVSMCDAVVFTLWLHCIHDYYFSNFPHRD